MASWERGRRVGSGSFGTVSLAFDRSSGKAFAVKSVPLDSANRAFVLALENEIEILKSLSSPYIVQFLGNDTTREDGAAACRNLHMEFMPGGTLADLAGRKKPFDEIEVRAYARCLARALHYLHTVAGVLHCDVKGRNVLLGQAPGVAKLADFGAAVRISDEGSPNWGRGTPLWMAPEVARGERPRPESDVWSLGCTVIEMATGRHPWSDLEHKDPETVMFHIGYEGDLPEFPPHLSKLGRDFIDKCLRRDASERWTAEELLLHPFLAEAGDVAVDDSPRGVLDWANSEFSDSDRGNCSLECTSISNSTDLIACGRERVRCFGIFGGIVDWDCDGWEEVRTAEEPDLAGDEMNLDAHGREEELDQKKNSSSCGVGLESEDWGFSGVKYSVTSACKCSCLSDFVSHHRRIRVGRKLHIGWCELLLHLNVEVNTIYNINMKGTVCHDNI